MYSQYNSILNNNINFNNTNHDWMGGETDPLTGFSWRSGSKRDTTGIIFWNDAFLYDNNETNEKFAIIVIDTQGLFDNKTTTDNNAKIFGIGTLLSSIQVFNIIQRINEDQLNYLRFVTEFAKFGLDFNTEFEKPFQKLMFLVRDWVSSKDTG